MGTGSSAVTAHIPRLRAIEGVEVLGVANRTRESSERVARTLHIPRVYDTWTALMDDSEIDAVFVGTWPYMHHPVVLEALEHDKHVVTQARMAMSAAEAREMLAASLGRPDLVAKVMPSSILPPNLMAKLVELVNGGAIGKVLSADFAVRTGFADPDGLLGWREDRDLSGFNIMMVGARYESLMRILGPATSVTALTRLAYPLRRDEGGGKRPTTIPDHVEILAELSVGGVLHMSVSGVAGLGPPSELWVFGTEGTVRCLCDQRVDPDEPDPPWLQLGCRGDVRPSAVHVPHATEGRIEPEQEFIAAIRGEGPVGDTTFQDGVRYVEFTEAVTRSAQTGRSAALPL